ncbi:hypothetical protein TgHK011_006829 [Trichoderma gracile]|nr:hypothetical protein TgHK011_006829 [Trichoderma gracile]
MLKHEDYTVGWICGITTEYVAAQCFLDGTHEGPDDVSANDNNDYTLGNIGKHNVVIAVLPDGEYGSASAATVAKDMLHTFPNIRIGLLVGIGGGAPREKHDIRLGDVVVSAPRDRTTGGVLHYDLAKTIQNQTEEPISYLNLPPTLLRTALNGLRAKYESDGHQIQKSIDQVFEKKPRLRKKYTRPDQSSDRLYQSGIVHRLSCDSVCGNDPSNLVRRSDRTVDDDNPAIHYGLIASADQLQKDAVIRDKLAAEKDILCFETEAAGLMNHFPCLVIRGICDYADSHGNTAWQGYAAMAAAAYAKDLLSRIPISKVQAEKKIGEILSGVQEGVNKLLDIHHDQDEKTILNWLTPIDYAAVQMDHIARRQPGTGQWFLNSAEYQTWLKGDRQTLFCPGIPGAGKTIITAIVVDDIYKRFYNDTNVGIAYLYCDYRRQQEQTVEQLLLSLVKQLAQRQAPVPKEVSEIYSEYQRQPKALSFGEILMLLHSVSKLFSRVFVIVDALDEFRTDGCRRTFLNGILKLQAQEYASIFLTARFIPDILNIFEESATLEIRAQDEDVQQFIANQITRLPSFVLNDTELQSMIKTSIAEAVDGMFLLAPLHMDALSQEPTVGHIELALKRLPRSLDEMYERAMIRVENQGGGTRDLAKKILAWVINARRALSPTELQHAAAVEPGMSEMNWKFVPSIDVISTICAGLITIDHQSNAVRLVHYTTKEYFERTQGIWSLDQAIIAKVCIAYLSFSAFESGICPTSSEFATRLRQNPLYYYAARYWGCHSREASLCDQGLMNFLLCNAKVEASFQVSMTDKWHPRYMKYTQRPPKIVTGLHLAAYFGLKEAVRSLLTSYEPDVKDDYNRTPLSYAATNDHKAVVQLLLDTEMVDVNTKDCDQETPLFKSAKNNHAAVVELLLRQAGIDADCPVRDGWAIDGRTPLSIAAENGHDAVVKVLLESDNVDMNFKSDSEGRSPLSYAAGRGHEAVVKLLLAKDAIEPDSIPSTNFYSGGCTPLSFAARNGHETVVKQLLAHPGIDPDSQSRNSMVLGRTPLSFAAENGHVGVVKLLLAQPGVDPMSTAVSESQFSGSHRYIGTPLSLAAKYGHEEVVRLLLTPETVNDHYLEQNVYDSGRTALSYAAENGHEAVVRLLLATKDVDVHIKSTGPYNSGRSALSYAAENGNEAVVALLLAAERASGRGSTINYRSARGWGPYVGDTALSLAASKGHDVVVRLLLAVEGIDVNSRDSGGQTAMLLAAKKGHEAVVRLLLAVEGVDVNIRDHLRRTAIMRAAEQGHEAVVRLLLAEEGVGDGLEDWQGQTAPMLAVQEGHKVVVRVLLDVDGIPVNPDEWVKEDESDEHYIKSRQRGFKRIRYT